MSLNFIETILDKLSPRDSGNSLLKNWTGSQSFIGGNGSFNDSILCKYQEALLDTNDSSSMNLSNKRSPLESTMFPFHHSIASNSLVSRVSKLFFPTPLTFQDYNLSVQEINTNHKIALNKRNHSENLWEEFMQEALNLAVNISNHHSSNFDYTQNKNNSAEQYIKTSDLSDTIATICANSAVKNLPSMVVECFIEGSSSQPIEKQMEPEVAVKVLASSSAQEKGKKFHVQDMAVVTVCDSSTASKSKKLTADNGTLNQELTNRKTKELQKRSKNRRRRQKRSNKNKNMQKHSSNVSIDQNPKLQKLCETDSAMSQIGCGLLNDMQKCVGVNSAMLCNVINIKDNANSVQIILPSVSSFVITVDSAGEDSDWDENSDCEWLNDTSEFEFSGLNVANLPCSKPNKSLLSVPTCQDEDLEALQLNMLLHRVNKEWNEATKDLDGKSRSSTKVSFVPDDELVEVLPVEIYERKGEWEMYAIERLRFKRRIDELDKIISPCLTKEHREKILEKYHTTDL